MMKPSSTDLKKKDCWAHKLSWKLLLYAGNLKEKSYEVHGSSLELLLHIGIRNFLLLLAHNVDIVGCDYIDQSYQ